MYERLTEGADAVLRAGVARGDVHGVVGLVTTPDGTVYEHAFGARNLATDTPMTPDTVFAVASLTKAVASTAVMQAVERGLVTLDQPLGGILPWLGEAKVLAGYDADGEPLLRPPMRPVTLRHLLTHTSGFGYDHWSADTFGYLQRHPAPFATHAFIRTPLLFDPGEGWAYGVGIDWAALVLEAVTGTDLEGWLQAELFGPLRMEASWKLTPATFARLAPNHHRQPDGTLRPATPRHPERGDFDSGGAGIHTTAADYAKFVRMILDRGRGPDGTRVLAEETVALMCRPDAAPNNTVLPLVSVDPPVSNSGEFFPGLPKRHSLAFMVNDEEATTGRSAGSLAWAGVANAYYWIDPKRGIGGIYLTQILPFLDTRALPLFHAFETAVYDGLHAEAADVPAATPPAPQGRGPSG
jgi:CubicO group peptidase (beta-lactamase class C family)